MNFLKFLVKILWLPALAIGLAVLTALFGLAIPIILACIFLGYLGHEFYEDFIR